MCVILLRLSLSESFLPSFFFGVCVSLHKLSTDDDNASMMWAWPAGPEEASFSFGAMIKLKFGGCSAL